MTATAPIEKPSGTLRIKNNSDKEYKEKFRGQLITIPPRGTIDMEYFDGIMFYGQYVTPTKDDAGNYLTCKPLTKEIVSLDTSWTPKQWISHADGKVFATEAELKAHVEANADKFVPQRNEELDKALAAQNKTDEVLSKLVGVLGTITERLDKLESPKRGKKSDTNRTNHSSEASE